MREFSRKAKYFLAGAITTGALIPLTLKAIDTIPIRFSEGDVISATVLNQLFARVNATTNLPSVGGLIGEWSCSEALQAGGPLTTDGWTPHSSGLVNTREQTISIQGDAASGNMTVTGSQSTPFTYSVPTLTNSVGGLSWGSTSQAPKTAYASLIANTRLLAMKADYQQTDVVLVDQMTRAVTTVSTRTYANVYSISSIASDRFEWGNGGGSTASCVKTSGPPAPANGLSIVIQGGTAMLAWVDQSSNESGFKVQRKFSAQGDWQTLTTTSANSVTYTDSAVPSGTYAYRVIATNTAGDSISSSEVQGVIQ